MGSCWPAVSTKEPQLNDILEGLVRGAELDALSRQESRSLAEVQRGALAATPALNALDYLAGASRIRIIAEIKRASPSRGVLAEIKDARELAKLYERAGASAISVLTESRKFLGSLEDLALVKSVVGIPVLRKDFITSPYQVFEAREAGADMILLMASVLDQQTLSNLHSLVLELGMTALVEVHDSVEMDRATQIGAKLIGVNARDLKTFELDRNLFADLVESFPPDATRVAESAVRTPEDVLNYRRAGADVVLIGEALVTSDPVETLQKFLEVA